MQRCRLGDGADQAEHLPARRIADDDRQFWTSHGINNREAFAGCGEWLVDSHPAGDFDRVACIEWNGRRYDPHAWVGEIERGRLRRVGGPQFQAVRSALWLGC